MGTNRSYNFAITRAHYPVIVTTDADVFFEPDALIYLINRLLDDDRIAAVTGELRPVKNTSTTTVLEGVYRSFYGRMCEWESALDSTYNFNGALVAFRSDRISRINDKLGADDANTAFEAIRKGFRAVYEKKAIVYEDIPRSFTVQYRQKTRRATGLIEATLSNLDLLRKNTPFSRLFYPLRIFMYVCSPPIFLISARALLCLAVPGESCFPYGRHCPACRDRDSLETESGLCFYPEPVLSYHGVARASEKICGYGTAHQRKRRNNQKKIYMDLKIVPSAYQLRIISSRW